VWKVIDGSRRSGPPLSKLKKKKKRKTINKSIQKKPTIFPNPSTVKY